MIATDPRQMAFYTIADLEALAAMAEEVASEGGPAAERAAALATQYRAVLAHRQGHQDAPAAPVVNDDYTEIGRRAGSPAANQHGTFTVHAASDAQIRFLSKLLAEKDLSAAGGILGPIEVPADLTKVSKTSASALIDRLLKLPAKGGSATPAPGDLATEKQRALIDKLLDEKDLQAMVFNPSPGVSLECRTDWNLAVSSFTKFQASKAIDALFSYPRKPVAAAAPAAEIPAGAYRLADGRVVRVYLGQQSGKMLCAELVDVTAEHRDDAWSYLGMASRFITADTHRMTVEECEAIAGSGQASFSWCCVCGRKLDDPNSVARGIGPVCRAKQGGM